jgi:hypothetical protein
VKISSLVAGLKTQLLVAVDLGYTAQQRMQSIMQELGEIEE